MLEDAGVESKDFCSVYKTGRVAYRHNDKANTRGGVKPFTSSLDICRVDISFKDDVTVILLLLHKATSHNGCLN